MAKDSAGLKPHLPVVPKVGGKDGHGLKLKTDMAGLGSAKSKPKAIGRFLKNPGKLSGSKT